MSAQTCKETYRVDLLENNNEVVVVTGDAFIICLQLAMLVYIARTCIKVRNGYLKLNNYTTGVIALMTVAICLGIMENIVCMAAFTDPESGAFTFYFANCGLGFQMLADFHNLLMYYSMLLIAYQYSVVSKQIDHIV